MSARQLDYTEKDVTTIYDALRRCNPHDIACALVGPSAKIAEAQGSSRWDATGLAARRAASMLAALMRLEPDFEGTSGVLLPWKASHLGMLAGLSWPCALGMRIALPSGMGRAGRSRLLANALLQMSYV